MEIKEKISNREHKNYICFLKDNIELLTMNQVNRKSQGIYQKMSNYIKTKRPQQCRTHHQKLMKKF